MRRLGQGLLVGALVLGGVGCDAVDQAKDAIEQAQTQQEQQEAGKLLAFRTTVTSLRESANIWFAQIQSAPAPAFARKAAEAVGSTYQSFFTTLNVLEVPDGARDELQTLLIRTNETARIGRDAGAALDDAQFLFLVQALQQSMAQTDVAIAALDQALAAG